jgi:phospholipase/lecithinase/hemolysin
LDEVMGQNLVFDKMMGPTPKKEAMVADNNFSVTIAPFEPGMIAQMSQDINSALQTMKKVK